MEAASGTWICRLSTFDLGEICLCVSGIVSAIWIKLKWTSDGCNVCFYTAFFFYICMISFSVKLFNSLHCHQNGINNTSAGRLIFELLVHLFPSVSSGFNISTFFPWVTSLMSFICAGCILCDVHFVCLL